MLLYICNQLNKRNEEIIMTKNFEVKAINEDEVKSFLLDFYGVDSIDSIVHRELSGLAPLNNFKYVDEYVWGIEYLLGSNTNNQ